MKKNFVIILVLLLLTLACNLPSATPAPSTAPPTLPAPPTALTILEPTAILETATPLTPTIEHILYPENTTSSGKRVYDARSVDTAPEKRAPYGDSYDINRLERPFTQEMSYVPDLDIVSFNLTSDAEWYYVSIELIGKDPNNPIDIRYGVEIDNDADGFGDVIIWANAPYTQEWTNENLKVYLDRNHNSAGLSAVRSDAPLTTDGYESPIFDLLGGLVDDPDLAWVRTTYDADATIQFAFKRSLPSPGFMLGVLADAGLRDVGQLDYVDRFTEAEAGSPVRNNEHYPLGELYLFDNTCREAYGFEPTGYEPMLCPPPAPADTPDETASCPENPLQYGTQGACEAAGCSWKVTQGDTQYDIEYCASP